MKGRSKTKALLAGVALAGLLGACQDTRGGATAGATAPEASATPTSVSTPEVQVPAATATHVVVTAHGGVAEPNRRLTPGSVFTAATVSQICVSGYTRTVRNVPDSTRLAVFAAYGIAYPPKTGAYELDHLVPLEVGGNNAATNLWPQPYHGAPGSADVKDHLENHLHALVCSGQVGLRTAQAAFEGDWYTAAARYNPIVVRGAATTAPRPVQKQAPAPVPAPAQPAAPGGGATAMCNDGTYSYAAHHQGACSHHGGVAVFYK